MEMQEIWEKALKNTQIIRPRVKNLLTFDTTALPYIFLAESAVNKADTVVRQGKILAEKPSIVLPFDLPQFEGFDFKKNFDFNEDTFTNFLLVRGMRFPSLKYNNKTNSLDIFEGRLEKAISYYGNKLQRSEDVDTGLVVGPEDCWQFSVMIFMCTQVAKSADNDIKNLFEDFKRRKNI